MTTDEVLNQLNKIIKPYTQVGIPQSTYSNIIHRIKAGTCKPKTMEGLFAKFGYFKQVEQWDKK